MLALSNGWASDDALPLQGDSPQLPGEVRIPGLQGSSDSPGDTFSDGGQVPWRVDDGYGNVDRSPFPQGGSVKQDRQPLEISGSVLYTVGFRFVRVLDTSDPSSPVEMLCLLDGNGDVLLSIVLSSQGAEGDNIPGTSDRDLSAPVFYTTR